MILFYVFEKCVITKTNKYINISINISKYSFYIQSKNKEISKNDI